MCDHFETETPDEFLISPPSKDAAYRALGLPSPIPCDCEICEAGGSCVLEPFATTMGDLVERIEWRNVAAALRGLGLVVSPAEDATEERKAPASFATEPEGDEGDFANTTWMLNPEPELRAAGASRHQIYRFREKVRVLEELRDGADLIGEAFVKAVRDEVEAVKARISAAKRSRERALNGITAASRVPLAKIEPKKAKRSELGFLDPYEVEPGVYEIPGLAPAKRSFPAKRGLH